jgi:SAM-dependent methyltransferase
MSVDHAETIEAVRRYFDEFGDQEWLRLGEDIAGRVALEVHRRFLRRFVPPGARVLEIGAGPGRFTAELAALGCQIVVTDLSPVQLELNEQRLHGTAAEHNVVRRELVDVCDTSRYGDDEFDVVLAYGGPLSYAFDRAHEAMEGLVRITAPAGVIIASVMSLLGTWRRFLPAVAELAETVGEEASDATLRTGDLRHVQPDGQGHLCRMFRCSDIQGLATRSRATILAASASNWASLGDQETLERIEADPERWRRFLDHEIAACAEPGAVDGGTHILFAAQPD